MVGGSGPLGEALDRALTAQGRTVVLTHRDHPVAHDRTVRCEATDGADVERVVAAVEARWGPIDVVVANAGSAALGLAAYLDPERFRVDVEVNLTAAFLAARAVGQRMVERRRGRVVLVGSVVGRTGAPGRSGYATAKSGLVGLARSLAVEWARRSITVNVVEVGLLPNGAERVTAAGRSGPRVVQGWLAAAPLGRVGTYDEAAAAVAFLASGGAAALTGAVIAVDGGWSVATIPCSGSAGRAERPLRIGERHV